MKHVPQILMERLLREEARVPLDVVLVDLWYLDEIIVNWQERDRQYALAGGLLRRKFVKDANSALRMASLWMRLREIHQFRHLAHVLDFADQVNLYAQSTPSALRQTAQRQGKGG